MILRMFSYDHDLFGFKARQATGAHPRLLANLRRHLDRTCRFAFFLERLRELVLSLASAGQFINRWGFPSKIGLSPHISPRHTPLLINII